MFEIGALKWSKDTIMKKVKEILLKMKIEVGDMIEESHSNDVLPQIHKLEWGNKNSLEKSKKEWNSTTPRI